MWFFGLHLFFVSQNYRVCVHRNTTKQCNFHYTDSRCLLIFMFVLFALYRMSKFMRQIPNFGGLGTLGRHYCTDDEEICHTYWTKDSLCCAKFYELCNGFASYRQINTSENWWQCMGQCHFTVMAAGGSGIRHSISHWTNTAAANLRSRCRDRPKPILWVSAVAETVAKTEDTHSAVAEPGAESLALVSATAVAKT